MTFVGTSKLHLGEDLLALSVCKSLLRLGSCRTLAAAASNCSVSPFAPATMALQNRLFCSGSILVCEWRGGDSTRSAISPKAFRMEVRACRPVTEEFVERFRSPQTAGYFILELAGAIVHREVVGECC
jgi:hypothetical protein